MGNQYKRHYLPSVDALEDRQLLSHSPLLIATLEPAEVPLFTQQNQASISYHPSDNAFDSAKSLYTSAPNEHAEEDKTLSQEDRQADFSQVSLAEASKHAESFQEGREKKFEQEKQHYDQDKETNQATEKHEEKQADFSQGESGHSEEQQDKNEKQIAQENSSDKNNQDTAVKENKTSSQAAHPSSNDTAKVSTTSSNKNISSTEGPNKPAGVSSPLLVNSATSSAKGDLEEGAVSKQAFALESTLVEEQMKSIEELGLLSEMQNANPLPPPLNFSEIPAVTPREVFPTAFGAPDGQANTSGEISYTADYPVMDEFLWAGLTADVMRLGTAALDEAIGCFRTEIELVDRFIADTLSHTKWFTWIEALVVTTIMVELGRRQARKRRSNRTATVEPDEDSTLSWFPGMPGSFTLD